MSSVAVFVFLLDNLAGFNNALNETLISRSKYTQNDIPPTIQNCDHATTDQILSAVSSDLDLNIVPTFRSNDDQLENEQFKEQSPEEIFTMIDNSLHEAEPKEDFYNRQMDVNVFDDDYTPFYRRNQPTGDHTDRKTEEAHNATTPEFPKSAPFLVAIFETLSNITAQTCAGTLLSPRWVLTAANCVNILSNLYNNNTNITHNSHYTVVAGSSNPLLDGSAHNVTQVLLHPEFNSTRPVHKGVELEGPYLALMRIDPEVEVATVELVADDVKSADVMVYGWILSKNESEHDSLNGTSMSALILNAGECQAMYSYRGNDVICLFNKDMDKNTTQLSSGGPVLMVQESRVKMLAVVQTDEHLFVAYPLTEHVSWINHVINNK